MINYYRILLENTKFVQFYLRSSNNYPSTYGNYWNFSNNFLWPSDSPIKSVRFIELIPTHWWMPFEKTFIHHDNIPDNDALEITSSASSASSSTMHHYVHIQCAFVRMKTAQCTIEHLIKYSPRPPQTITATNRLHCSTTDNGFVHDQQKKTRSGAFSPATECISMTVELVWMAFNASFISTRYARRSSCWACEHYS